MVVVYFEITSRYNDTVSCPILTISFFNFLLKLLSECSSSPPELLLSLLLHTHTDLVIIMIRRLSSHVHTYRAYPCVVVIAQVSPPEITSRYLNTHGRAGRHLRKKASKIFLTFSLTKLRFSSGRMLRTHAHTLLIFYTWFS